MNDELCGPKKMGNVECCEDCAALLPNIAQQCFVHHLIDVYQEQHAALVDLFWREMRAHGDTPEYIAARLREIKVPEAMINVYLEAEKEENSAGQERQEN